MHIPFHLAISGAAIFWLTALGSVIIIAGVILLIIGILYGEKNMPYLRFGLLVGGLGALLTIGGVATLVYTYGQVSLNGDRWNAALEQQVKARYGISINGYQAAYLSSGGYNYQYFSQGSAYVLRGGKPQEVTLYRVGDQFFLGHTGGESDSFKELPVTGR